MVTQATDEQSQQTNAVTYIQVWNPIILWMDSMVEPFFPQNLLELKDRFDSFLNNSFSNDKFFKQVSLIVLISFMKLIWCVGHLW